MYSCLSHLSELSISQDWVSYSEGRFSQSQAVHLALSILHTPTCPSVIHYVLRWREASIDIMLMDFPATRHMSQYKHLSFMNNPVSGILL